MMHEVARSSLSSILHVVLVCVVNVVMAYFLSHHLSGPADDSKDEEKFEAEVRAQQLQTERNGRGHVGQDRRSCGDQGRHSSSGDFPSPPFSSVF